MHISLTKSNGDRVALPYSGIAFMSQRSGQVEITMVDDVNRITVAETVGAIIAQAKDNLIQFEDRDDTLITYLVPSGNYYRMEEDNETGKGTLLFNYRNLPVDLAQDFDGALAALGPVPELVSGLQNFIFLGSWELAVETADAEPGDGLFRLDNAAPASATGAYIDSNPKALGNRKPSLDLAVSGSIMMIQQIDNPANTLYATVSANTDNTDYVDWTIGSVNVGGTVATGETYNFWLRI